MVTTHPLVTLPLPPVDPQDDGEDDGDADDEASHGGVAWTSGGHLASRATTFASHRGLVTLGYRSRK